MKQNKFPQTQNSKPETPAKPQNEEKSSELTEDDLENISGGTKLHSACATGKHFDSATITVK